MVMVVVVVVVVGDGGGGDAGGGGRGDGGGGAVVAAVSVPAAVFQNRTPTIFRSITAMITAGLQRNRSQRTAKLE